MDDPQEAIWEAIEYWRRLASDYRAPINDQQNAKVQLRLTVALALAEAKIAGSRLHTVQDVERVCYEAADLRKQLEEHMHTQDAR